MRALLYGVATWANTSSNQASKDPWSAASSYSNLVRFIVFLCNKTVAVKCVAVRTLPENSRFATSSDHVRYFSLLSKTKLLSEGMTISVALTAAVGFSQHGYDHFNDNGYDI